MTLSWTSFFLFICFHQRFIVYVNKGDHGYNNEEMDMKTIFRAFGPDFKKNFITEPFDSIHIYPLMCKLLDIEPAPHNGSLAVTENILVLNGEFRFSPKIVCCFFTFQRVLQVYIKLSNFLFYV